jgi:PAS domain S-box-containing protein
MDFTLQSAFLAEMSTLLILLAGAVLLYASFREKYLVPWIAGWSVFTLSKVFLALSSGRPALWTILAYVTYVMAVGLFATAVFFYVAQRKLLWPSIFALCVALPLELAYSLWRPYPVLHYLAFILCWSVSIVASVQLVRFAWGRLSVGRWLLAAMLLLLHLDTVGSVHRVIGTDILVELLLGIGIMTIVLDDSRVQVQRLDTLNNITHQISDSREFEPTVVMILEELRKITRAKASWFRILQGENLVLTAHSGLSQAFTEKVATIETSQSVSGFALREDEVCIVQSKESPPEIRAALLNEGIHHLLLVPVEGKHSRVGMFILGMPMYRAYTVREKEFLKAAAKQLGLAEENRKLLQQLVHSRNEWASTFDSIPDYILVHDLEYRILRANSVLLGRLRRSREDVVQHLCEEVLPGAITNWKGCPYCAHAECGGEEDPCFGGYSVVSTSAYTGEDHSRVGTVHVIKDITESKAAEERFTSLFNHMHEGVFVSTPEGHILDCNEAFVHMLGYDSKEDILKLDVAQSVYVDMEDRSKFLSEIERQGFVRNFEIVLRCKDGRKIHVIESSFATRSPNGTIERYQGVVLDVTEMKRAEDEIRELNTSLEHRVVERTHELRQSNEALRQSNEDLNQFAYAASHDLQEPLRMVALYSEILRQKYDGQLDSEADSFISSIITGARRMEMLLKDLLAYSQVGSAAGPSQEVDCNIIMQEVLLNLNAAITENQAEITWSKLPVIQAHPIRIVQLFQNLVGNAIKYRRDEPPRIHTSAERDGDRWLFVVQDNGIGIKPEYAKQVFGVFKRLHGRDYPGTGIGLAICQRIVERYDGRIWVDSEPGVGSRFCFWLPAEAAHEVEEPQLAAGSGYGA